MTCRSISLVDTLSIKRLAFLALWLVLLPFLIVGICLVMLVLAGWMVLEQIERLPAPWAVLRLRRT